MAAFGLFIGIINFEYNTYYYKHVTNKNIKKYPNAMDLPENKDFLTIVLKMIIISTTIISLYFTVQNNKYRLAWLRQYFEKALPSPVEIGYMHQDTEEVVEKRQKKHKDHHHNEND